MDDARVDELLELALSKLNGAAGDLAALVADGDDQYLLRVAQAIEDDLLATAQRFVLADSSPLVRRDAAVGALIGEFDRNVEATVLLAGLVGDVQAGNDRVRPDRLRQAAVDAATKSAWVRDQALVLLAPPATIPSTPTATMGN